MTANWQCTVPLPEGLEMLICRQDRRDPIMNLIIVLLVAAILLLGRIK